MSSRLSLEIELANTLGARLTQGKWFIGENDVTEGMQQLLSIIDRERVAGLATIAAIWRNEHKDYSHNRRKLDLKVLWSELYRALDKANTEFDELREEIL